MTATKPSFIVTIDTEGDNLWAKPKVIETRNSAYLSRFQSLCNQYELKPTYLTTWEMALARQFREVVRDPLACRLCEIGAHPHAWNSPPLASLTENDLFYQPYLQEYPREVMVDKMRTLTDLLELTFGVKMTSHRAGRWALNKDYVDILIESGYRVDCSVTPLVSWKSSLGSPVGDGGSDYRAFPRQEYFIDRQDISRPGNSPLLEIPMTVISSYDNPMACKVIKLLSDGSIMRRGLERIFPSKLWLRPNGRNLNSMLRIAADALASGSTYVEFMLHSSELMPGGSPYFPTPYSVESLYGHLETLFSFVRERFVGRTLTEHYDHFVSTSSSHQKNNQDDDKH